jgi:hypothetical protein
LDLSNEIEENLMQRREAYNVTKTTALGSNLMNKLFVQTAEEVAYDFIKFAKANSYGIEITSFALPWILDGDWEKVFQSYKLALNLEMRCRFTGFSWTWLRPAETLG